jgi:hypothetical protein
MKDLVNMDIIIFNFMDFVMYYGLILLGIGILLFGALWFFNSGVALSKKHSPHLFKDSSKDDL